MSNFEKPKSLILKNVKRSFMQGNQELKVLNGVNLEIKQGEIIALVGPSGSGKSTLLQIAGLLEKPDSGEVMIAENACGALSDNIRTMYRRTHLGFVYQYHNLLPEFTALENVLMPLMIAGRNDKETKERALWLLKKMGLEDRVTHRPTELSGGEQQRVAIARALANTPKLLLADEPTGNLDPKTSAVVFEELLRLVRETGLSAIIATHNPDLANKMDRKIALRGGELIDMRATALTGGSNFYDRVTTPKTEEE